MINDVDCDRNGYITFEEFIPLMTKVIHDDLYLEEEIRELLRYYGREYHGLITKPLLSKLLIALNDQLCQGKCVTSSFRKIGYRLAPKIISNISLK